MTALHDRLKHKLDELDFDFSQFTIEAFAERVGAHLDRHIEFIPLAMPTGLYGAWASDRELPLEYVFFNNALSPLHQEHSQLHELGHILLGHKTLKIGTAELEQLMTRDKLAGVLYRSQKDRAGQEEREAEELASLVQTIVHSQRGGEVSSSSQAGRAYLSVTFCDGEQA